ncbi:MAG TPA: M28 family metallopeptidase [Candidatus Dormibacteraeota bacterium]|nr:M28 family metallopeptidase [Candidatus Dormibacteraeota bacterium]
MVGVTYRKVLRVMAVGGALLLLGAGHQPRRASGARVSGVIREPSAPAAALKSFSGKRLLDHIRVLSSNKFEGRGPGSHGEDLSIAYIQAQFRQLGLEPGNPDGTYLQDVPMVGIRPDPTMALTFTGHGQTLHAQFEKDFVAWTKRMVPSVSMDADMVFAGYGIEAPERHWDDFKGVNVKGKVIVVLVSDPFPDKNETGKKIMTYYGRWTYKYEEAARLGAVGCVIVHETGAAGYPWEVVRDSWGAEQFDLVSANKNMNRAAVEAWITHSEAEQLFKAAGQNYDTLKAAATKPDFHPVDLDMKAQIEIHNTLRMIHSHNVIAKVTGSDPKLKNQYVIYTAHWDHFGIGPAVNGDRIYHGAADNASGVSALIEIARAYKQLQVPPRRSILFLSVTGEEQGLLGSRYYAEHPLYLLAQTAADINMDVMNVLGRTQDIVLVGKGKSTLDEVAAAAAREQGRVIKDDPEPEKGFYYRSDHFSFAQVGVPALDPDAGTDFVGKPAGWGMMMRDQYTKEHYHKPSDIIYPYWNMSGDVQDCRLYFLIGYKVANTTKMPEWKAGSEFRAVREESLRKGDGTN